MKLDSKYKTLQSFLQLKDAFTRFTLDWEFHPSTHFDTMVEALRAEYSAKESEIYYIDETDIDLDGLQYMKCGEIVDFGKETYLEKISTEEEHIYLYKNAKPVIFGLHVHEHFTEEIKPINHPVTMFLTRDSGIDKIKVEIGESYLIPKGIEHATLISEPNTIKITWK